MNTLSIDLSSTSTLLSESHIMNNQYVESILSARQQSVQALEGKLDMLKHLRQLTEATGITDHEEQFNSLSKSLEVLIHRFNRKALTIAVAGYARVGKSQLLQSMTGLGGHIIPASNGTHCTGAPSRICHLEGSKQPYADVEFYTEQAFLEEKIWPYFNLISLDKPQLFSDFLQLNLTDSLCDSDFTLDHLEHLLAYQENIDAYRNLLTGEHLVIKEEEVVNYIAQYHPEKPEQKFYKYFAVKEACIFCELPFSHMQSIQLLDMPGLGDTQIGALEMLLTKVGYEADVLLFVRRPQVNATGDTWMDYEKHFYTEVDRVMPNLPLKHWGLLALNHIKGSDINTDNLDSCSKLKQEAEDNPVLNFADISIADFSEHNEVCEHIFQPAITHLVNNVDKLDAYLLAGMDQKIADLISIIKDASLNLEGCVGSDGDRVYEDAFDRFWNRLARTLNDDLLSRYQQVRYEKSENFEQNLNEIFENLTHPGFLPTTAQIQEDYYGKSMSYRRSFNDYLDQIRVHITRDFQSLDVGLGHVVSALKQDVANALKETDLRALAPEQASEDFLKYILLN